MYRNIIRLLFELLLLSTSVYHVVQTGELGKYLCSGSIIFQELYFLMVGYIPMLGNGMIESTHDLLFYSLNICFSRSLCIFSLV